ncbi:MAG: diguanylate cyclase [Nostoc sp. TH1S01]|nr:diguanylate cyclase [Nostoc sp. TH1S01]
MSESQDPKQVNNDLGNAQLVEGLINTDTVTVGQMGGNGYNIHYSHSNIKNVYNLKLEPNIINDLVNLLRPFLEDERSRRPFLVSALGNDAPVLQHINWSGAVASFIPDMLCKLADYSEISPGKTAIWALLEYVRSQVGVDVQKRIDDLHPLIEPQTILRDTADSKLVEVFNQKTPDSSEQSLDKEAGDIFLKNLLPDSINTNSRVIGSIAMADIDDLTIINKHYSRDLGDQIIANTIDIINNKISKYNNIQAGRCGDDTFYILLPEIEIGMAESICEQIRISIETNAWSLLATDLRVTCSFSVSQFRATENSLETVVRAASGLKTAKIRGKNIVVRGPMFLPQKPSLNLRDYYS